METNNEINDSNLSNSKMDKIIYLVVANVLVIILAGVGVGIWYIFNPFAQPLLLAVLTGILLFPLKKKWTLASENWIVSNNPNVPLIFSLFYLTMVEIPSYFSEKILQVNFLSFKIY